MSIYTLKNKNQSRRPIFIYLDVGGVVELDFSGTNKWEEMAKDLGIEGEKFNKFNEIFPILEKEVCNGRDLETIIPELEKKLQIKFPPNYSFLMDFVNRFEVNEKIHPILVELKKSYRLGLLTNMYPGMLNAIKAKGLLPNIEWDVVVDSSVEGCQKPDDKIFEIAEQKAKVKPENIFFVENSLKHIEAARRRGWQTFLYNSLDVLKSNEELGRCLIER